MTPPDHFELPRLWVERSVSPEDSCHGVDAGRLERILDPATALGSFSAGYQVLDLPQSGAETAVVGTRSQFRAWLVLFAEHRRRPTACTAGLHALHRYHAECVLVLYSPQACPCRNCAPVLRVLSTALLS